MYSGKYVKQISIAISLYHQSTRMKLRLVFISLLILYYGPLVAQKKDTLHPKRMETLFTVTTGPSAAVGTFSQTHLAGFGVEAGGLTQFRKKQSSSRKHLLLLSWSAAGDYFWGRKEKVAGYSYQYKRYWLAHAYIGAALEIRKDLLVSLTAGPGIAQYNGSVNYNTGLQAAVHYAIAKRFFISPSFKLMQEPGTNWLAAAGLRVVMLVGGK